MGLNLPISLGKSLNFLSPDFCIHKIGVAAGLSRGGDPRSDEMPIGGSGGGEYIWDHRCSKTPLCSKNKGMVDFLAEELMIKIELVRTKRKGPVDYQ